MKLCMQLRLKLKKVHRALEIDWALWLHQYIEFITAARKTATESSEKKFFKLLNNNIYVKTIENLKKRRSIKLQQRAMRGKINQFP